MLTVADVRSSLSRYAGANNDFLARLNEVCARLIQTGSFKGTKVPLTLVIYADAEGNSIVSLPPGYDTILAGAVRNPDQPRWGMPLGVANEWNEFSKNGLGYGGLTDNFQEVSGRFAVFQEWQGGMKIRLKFETLESAGSVHLHGNFNGARVYYAGEGERLAFNGTSIPGTVTSVKKFEAKGFSAVKPVTNGQIQVFCVDSDGNETAVGLWGPTEKVPRLRRYKVPTCEGVEPVAASDDTGGGGVDPNDFFTKDEVLALFNASDVITVNSGGNTSLDYAMFFLRVVKVIAQAGILPYEAKFALGTDGITNGATFRIKIEIEQSSNPSLLFYSGTVAGTLMYEMDGDSSNPLYTTLVFSFDGTDWHYEGRETV